MLSSHWPGNPLSRGTGFSQMPRNKSGETAMRTAIASLALLAGLGGLAQAQESPSAPMTDPAMSQPAPVTTAPPSADAMAPAAPPAAPEAPAEPPPTLPTEGFGADVLSILTRVCVPSVSQNQPIDDLAKAIGMRQNRRDKSWSMTLQERPYTITVLPRGANTNVCNVNITYPIGGQRPIVNALNVWSFLHDPELVMQRNDFVVGADGVKRVTLSWEHYNAQESTGLVFVQLKKPDDSPLERNYDQATLLYSERTF